MKTIAVQIQRDGINVSMQAVRGYLSSAAALAHRDYAESLGLIDKAIDELTMLKKSMAAKCDNPSMG